MGALAALVTVAALGGCGGGRTSAGQCDGGAAAGGLPGVGGGGAPGTAAGGASGAAAGGAPGNAQTCAPGTDPDLPVAPQRTVPLTADQIAKALRALFGAEAMERVLASGMLDTTPVLDRHFPPIEDGDVTIDARAFATRDAVGQLIGEYVRDNFGQVTKCASPTDACALAYLDELASKAYRRDLSQDEQTSLRDLFARLRSQEVQGYLVSATVEEATQYATYGLVISPQFLWRYEVGDAATPPAALAMGQSSTRLTDDELASAVSFFLTDEPPDDELRAAARAGTLRADLDRHVARILEGATARDWLRSAMELHFLLNQLPATPVDPGRWPIDAALVASMQTSSRMFLDEVLWRGQLNDLLTSRVAFLDDRLASVIYNVPIPSDAAPGAFVRTTLPADQRSGLLTDAGFLTTFSGAGGVQLFRRGRLIAGVLACAVPPALDRTPEGERLEAQQGQELLRLTAAEQVAGRRRPDCAGCHEAGDAVGLVLDAYDAVGRFRTVGDLGTPVETSVNLPASIGAGRVDDAVEMAAAVAQSPAFVQCMARSILQLATSDPSGAPWPLPGCAAARIAAQFRSGDAQTFGALIRTVAASPVFTLRVVAP